MCVCAREERGREREGEMIERDFGKTGLQKLESFFSFFLLIVLLLGVRCVCGCVVMAFLVSYDWR